MKNSLIFFNIYLALFFIISCNLAADDTASPKKIKLGIDVLLEKRIDLIQGKKVGLITNPTGLTGNYLPTIDALHQHPAVQLVALFGPEHGIRGDIPAGENVATYQDKQTGLPVYSLYGKTRKPTPEMLAGIDILLYDIQDIGSRAYTYIYTMAYAMEAAKENNLRFIVLDRPNPLGGERVEGNVLEPEFSSFIGLYPIPQVYGMTVGELALFFNTELHINCRLEVVPMAGWTRQMLFAETGLFWTPTSPHVPRAETSFFVAATGCIGELDTISEGVGYPLPFELMGAPWMDGQKLAGELNRRGLPGVYFRPVFFRNYYLKFVKEQCSGIQIHITEYQKVEPAKIQVHILTAIKQLHPEQNIFDTKRIDMFNKAFGTDAVVRAVLNNESAEKIINSWETDLKAFRLKRQKYLLYH
jgi:uncharacterized protein YbbC (DUF1343 family)